MSEIDEELLLAGASALAESSKLPDWLAPVALGRSMVPLAKLVIERVYPLIAEHIRAEERQQIAEEIRRRKPDLTARSVKTDRSWWTGFNHGLDCALSDLAAGSIPAAVQSDRCPECRHGSHGTICLNLQSGNDCACTFDTRLRR